MYKYLLVDCCTGVIANYSHKSVVISERVVSRAYYETLFIRVYLYVIRIILIHQPDFSCLMNLIY